MADMWVIIAQLPLMLILAFFVGYEPVIFMGIGLLGMVFWLFSEDIGLKRSAFIIFVIAEALFVTSTLFHISVGSITILPKDPFSFIFLGAVTNYAINLFK